VVRFAFAGHAIFTLVSKRTGERRTFRLSAVEDKPGCYFASLLTGPSNTSDYRYLGFVYDRDGAYQVKPNRDGWGKDALVILGWFLRNVGSPELLVQAEVWHEGRCGRCGRTLTVPESIASGIGPVCEELQAAA
jgi:hypothetical protein